MSIKNKAWRWLVVAAMLLPVLAGCAQPTPEVIEKPVTVVVEKEVTVKETVVVEKEKEVVVVVTPTAVPTAAATPLPAVNIPFKNPDTFIVATIGDPETLDPAWTYETAGAGIESNIYEGLVFFNREQVTEFVPALAESWTISDDGLTYVFNIRKGVTFHQGGTLEPHDVAYSLQRGMLQDRAGGPQWMMLEPIFGYSSIKDLAMDTAKVDDFAKVDAASLVAVAELVKAAVVADDAAGTVTLKLATPAPWFFQVLAQNFGAVLDMEWMVEKGDWDGASDTWTKWTDPAQEATVLFNVANGTGPYMLEKWEPGVEITMVANDKYWRTEPMWEGGPSGVAKIKRAAIKIVTEWGTRLAMLQAGDADFTSVDLAYISQVDPMVKDVYLGPTMDAPKETINPNGALRLFKGLANPSMTPAQFFQKINVEGGNPFLGSGALDGNGIPADFFSDIHVRKAFNYSFDWETFIADALQGEGVQPRGPIVAPLLGYDENQPVYSYDPVKAEEEFKAAWGGEVWAKGFYVQMHYNIGNDTRRIAAEVLKQNIEALNPKFNIEVVAVPWPTLLAARRAGKLPVYVGGWLQDYADPSNWVHPFMHCGAGAYAPAQNLGEEFCTKAEELIAAGVSSSDPAVREPIYKELQNLAYEYAIDIFLFQTTGRHYEQSWIQGYYYNPQYPGSYSWIYALSKVQP
ncbi:MAG: ABC transporter substrate-binding protein [Chloroflexi bacterium]|nr:ABC transporter substrate-binding protein [Chloroflexota bacterium]